MNNLAGALRESAAGYPDLVAVDFMGQKTTYRELESAANKIAAALREMGVEKGDRVAIYCINSPYFVAGFYGILKLGATVVTVSLLLHHSEVDYVLKDSGARAVIFSDIFAPNIAAIRGNLPELKNLIAVGKTDLPDTVSYAEIMGTSLFRNRVFNQVNPFVDVFNR